VVRVGIGSRIGPHFAPQSGGNGSKMAVDGLGGLGYQSRCRRAVLYIVSEVGAQTGSRFEKPEVVFPVQEMDRNAQICVVAGLRGRGMPVLAAFRTAGPPRVVFGVRSRRGRRGAARARRRPRILSPPRDRGRFPFGGHDSDHAECKGVSSIVSRLRYLGFVPCYIQHILYHINREISRQPIGRFLRNFACG